MGEDMQDLLNSIENSYEMSWLTLIYKDPDIEKEYQQHLWPGNNNLAMVTLYQFMITFLSVIVLSSIKYAKVTLDIK
jgi:hypothetical protein